VLPCCLIRLMDAVDGEMCYSGDAE
jgi:hypothetical protein